ncbi:Putative alpha-L-fucosidase 1 [Dendrobium catenatum]|uniref:Alpha-L-fucosidase 1 n=2 Tax=Dendrobium catenatum TaxID=906689 RepID=A0A2I0X039_9ASPA|nr:Putative alpha-L-fucosidase 1 [Dendrobium catenatum]
MCCVASLSSSARSLTLSTVHCGSLSGIRSNDSRRQPERTAKAAAAALVAEQDHMRILISEAIYDLRLKREALGIFKVQTVMSKYSAGIGMSLKRKYTVVGGLLKGCLPKIESRLGSLMECLTNPFWIDRIVKHRNLISVFLYLFMLRYALEGDPYGHDWVAPECDVSIRTGWFWHSSENPKSPMTLLDIYYTSVGRNCLLILNVPPNSSGLISDEDIQALQNFTAMRHTIFSQNLAKDAIVSASSTRGGPDESHFSPSNVIEEGIYSYWAPDEFQATWTLILDLGQSISFNVLQAQEPIQMGQRVVEFHADVLKEGEWEIIANGTTIGYKRLLLFPIVKAQFLRFVVDKSRADPLISYLGIYFDPFSPSHNLLSTSRRSSFNNIRDLDLRASKNSSRVSVI